MSVERRRADAPSRCNQGMRMTNCAVSCEHRWGFNAPKKNRRSPWTESERSSEGSKGRRTLYIIAASVSAIAMGSSAPFIGICATLLSL